MFDVFLICPVRSASEEQKKEIGAYIEKLNAEGKKVYYPATDTNQTDDIGFRICKDNAVAILNSKEVHIFWDKNSQGSLFDLGVAFALCKPLVIANKIEKTEGKSFANMLLKWSSL